VPTPRIERPVHSHSVGAVRPQYAGEYVPNAIGTIYHYVTQYSAYALIALAVLLAGYIAWRVARHRRRRAALARQPARKQLRDCPPSD
jgi:hypothetical protein